MQRFQKHHRVFYIEEPIYDAPSRFNAISEDPESGVLVVTPHLPESARNDLREIQALFNLFLESMAITNMILWYYTPMALEFTRQLHPDLVVYDCMDELSGFKFAPPAIRDYEQQLFKRADLVFTGGVSLYNAKKHLHRDIYPFPSSIDKSHFQKARDIINQPGDQSSIPYPRIGFYGVIDERFDISLISTLASMHAEWHFVLIGPIVKIDPASLPDRSNIHFLGQKDYKELPAYLGGWDIAMMPFLLNEATEYISPTKTPEYLAGGKPVVSTGIKDVIEPYGKLGLVEIANTPDEFSVAITGFLNRTDTTAWIKKADDFLAHTSWDLTWGQMDKLIQDKLRNIKNTVPEKLNKEAYV
jgi:UDP-galactopyranose mutase